MRLFFALWPDSDVRAQLGAWARAAHPFTGGRAMRAEGVHATLVFLGETPDDRLGVIEAAAGGVRFDPFELVLDAARYWPHNRIVWAGASAVPEPLTALATALRARLSEAVVPFDAKPFVPHLTLIRDARTRPAGDFAPIRWTVAEFVLVLSANGRYSVMQRWAGSRVR